MKPHKIDHIAWEFEDFRERLENYSERVENSPYHIMQLVKDLWIHTTNIEDNLNRLRETTRTIETELEHL